MISRRDLRRRQRPLSWAAGSLFACAALLAACASPNVVEDAPPVDEEAAGYWVVGYHPWWMRDAWQTYDLSVVSKLMFFDLAVESDGTIEERNGWPEAWQPMAERARAAGTVVVPTVTILDTGTFVDLFADPAATYALRQNLVALLKETPTGGLHLDFEVFDPIPAYVRRAFTSFVRDLRADLDAWRPEAYLSVFTLALDPYDVYDEAALARHADYLVVQGYDLHWSGDGEAGPVAPLDGWDGRNWRAIVDRYLRLDVPRKKIVMSVPYYGYEWPTEDDRPGAPTRGTGAFTTYAPMPPEAGTGALASARERAAQFGVQRDPASGSPYYVFRDSTGWRQGWFEDVESLRAKYDFVKRQGLGGVAVFTPGYGDAALDAALHAAFAAEPSAVAARRARVDGRLTRAD